MSALINALCNFSIVETESLGLNSASMHTSKENINNINIRSYEI